MKISWVFANNFKFDEADHIEAAKTVGSTWGSWRTWMECSTDNVICHDAAKAQELIKKAFHAVCNLYVPESVYHDLGSPVGVRIFQGDFGRTNTNLDDIVAMHLAAKDSDVVILAGFDLDPVDGSDRKRELLDYHGLIYGAVTAFPQTQWVALNSHCNAAYSNLANFTTDRLKNVLQYTV